MKWYQSPLFISGFIILLSGISYIIRTMLDENDWGMLFGIPAMITGGLLITVHFLLGWLLNVTKRNQLIAEFSLLFILFILLLIMN